MKQLFLLPAALLLMASAAFAQNAGLNTFIDRHKQDPAFTYAFLSKDLFEVAAQAEIADHDWKKLQNVVKNIGSLRILAADDISNGMALYREARELVPADEFDELLTVRDGQDNVRIWAKSEEAVVTDLVLLVGTREEFVLVCFAGALELNNLSELARLFDAGGAEQLAQTAEKVAVDFQVSPNPSTGEFVLTYGDAADLPQQLSVIDQNGRYVSVLNLSGVATQPVVLRDLPSGLYWLQLKTQQGRVGVKQIQILKK